MRKTNKKAVLVKVGLLHDCHFLQLRPGDVTLFAMSFHFLVAAKGQRRVLFLLSPPEFEWESASQIVENIKER